MSTHYVVDYELCALVFLVVVALHFYLSKKITNIKNSIFSAFIIISVISISVDVITAFTIDNPSLVPDWLDYSMMIVLFTAQNTLSVLVVLYIICLAEMSIKKQKKVLIPLLLPYIVCELMIISTPFTSWVFEFTVEGEYVKHFGSMLMYMTNFFYLAVSVIEAIYLRRRMKKKQIFTAMCFAMFSLIAAVLQFLFPDYLLIGCAIGLSVALFYLSLQNPEGLIDDLTGVFNRGCYVSSLNEIISTDSTAYITVVSLDDMKLINNTFSMNAGSELIKQVAQYIGSLDCGDVYRLLGDQFAVISKNEKDSETVAGALSSRLREDWKVDGFTIEAAACICYGAKVDNTVTTSQFFVLTDRAIANAKSKGHNTVVKIDDAVRSETQRMLDIENALRRAIKEDRLEVYFQPIYSVSEKRFVGAEALSRFYDPEFGSVSPNVFIPIAEKNGLILQLGAHLLRKVCSFIADNDIRKKTCLRFVDVNLSSVELLSDTLPKFIVETLNSYDLTDMMRFEITETAATITFEKATDNVRKLRESGINFAIDDYGSGYANVDSILNLPFSTVKIDRSLLEAGARDEKSRIILENTYAMFKKLGLDTVTEGVETATQRDMVVSMGSDYIQGFYYARPMSSEEYLGFLFEKCSLEPEDK